MLWSSLRWPLLFSNVLHPDLLLFLDRTNVAAFPRSWNQLKLLRHQLNYVLTTRPPDMLFIAAVGLRAEHHPHSALRWLEQKPFPSAPLSIQY